MTLDAGYARAIKRALDETYERARDTARDFDPVQGRVVVFSDQHRGSGDRADDFRHCEHAYSAALGYYLDSGFELFVLGDSEELWEDSPGPIFDRYGAVYDLEREFATAEPPRSLRFWGNHDDRWADAERATAELPPMIGTRSTMREAIRLELGEDYANATIFLVHGHQGTSASDRYGALARLPVRYLWRPIQRLLGISATTPANDSELRGDHNEAMFRWASSQETGVILIAGHTHKPVFAGSEPPGPSVRSIATLERLRSDALDRGDTASAAGLRAELEYARTSLRRPEKLVTAYPPCYFNTGCCSYPDGDITGIEIADGEIRLVRWPADLREFRTSEGEGLDVEGRVLARERLADVVRAVRSPEEEPRLRVADVVPG